MRDGTSSLVRMLLTCRSTVRSLSDESVGDGPVGLAGRDQAQHLQLAWGQPARASRPGAGRAAYRAGRGRAGAEPHEAVAGRRRAPTPRRRRRRARGSQPEQRRACGRPRRATPRCCQSWQACATTISAAAWFPSASSTAPDGVRGHRGQHAGAKVAAISPARRRRRAPDRCRPPASMISTQAGSSWRAGTGPSVVSPSTPADRRAAAAVRPLRQPQQREAGLWLASRARLARR